MDDQTIPPVDPAAQAPSDDGLLTGEQIYDQIMAEIEPDLTSALYPTLAVKYAGETEEQKQARMARYEAAFAEYDARYEKFLTTVTSESHAIKKEARDAAESKDRAQDDKAEGDLLKQMETA
jgi:hypothetical protein